MRYRVTFAKRFQSDGNESADNPTAEVDLDLADGIVADKEFVGRFDPESKHSQEVLDEDDAFLAIASAEMWEYDIVDGRQDEFVDALRNSEVVMEYTVVDETNVDEDDLSSTSLDDSSSKYPDVDSETTLDNDADAEVDAVSDVRPGRSGARGLDDGPGGQPTGDATADGMGPSRPYMVSDEGEGYISEETGGIDDLTVLDSDDPSLGLTDVDGKSPDDWAADTGPDATPSTRVRRARSSS